MSAAVPAAADSAVSAPVDGRVSKRVVLVGLVAVNLLSALLHGWAVMQWSWFQDDWLYVQRAASWPFWDYLFMNYNGHAMPLKFLLVWILTAWAPLEFAPAGAILVSLIIASGVAWTALLVRIFGCKWQVVFAATALLLSPIFISPTLWWAAGIQTYSLQLGMALSLWGTFEYVRGGRRRMLWLTIIAFTLAVLTWEKALLIAVPVAFAAVLLPGVDRTGRATWLRIRVLVSAIALVAVALAVLFLWVTRNPVVGQAELSIPSLGMLLSFMFTAHFGLTVPGLVGGPWSGIPGLTSVYPAIGMIWEWLLAAATCLLIAWGVIFRRAGWAAIVMVAVYGCLTWGLVVGSSRYESLGEYAALDPRYSADMAPVAILGFLYLITATRVESAGRTAWRYILPGKLIALGPWLLGVASILVVISSLSTWSTMMTGLIPLSPRSWVDNLKDTAKSAGAESAFDSNAPINVLYPYYYPAEGRLSAMLAPLDLPLKFDEPSTKLYAADAEGRLAPARIDTRSTSLPGPAGECGYIVDGTQWTFVPMSSALYAWNWGVQISYFSQGAPEFEVRALDDSFMAEALPGLGSVEGVLVSPVEVVAVRSGNGVGACVPSITVGLVEPGAGP